jgi:hypothetical protein
LPCIGNVGFDRFSAFPGVPIAIGSVNCGV